MRTIVDAHHHLWDNSRHHYPKLFAGANDAKRSYGSMSTHLARNYLVADFMADIGNQPVVKSVHVQCSYDPQEIVWLQATADDPASKGFPHGIVSWVDFLSAGIERTLEDQATFKNFRGVRNTVASHPDPQFDRPHAYFIKHPRWREKIGLLTKYNASLDIAVYDNQMPDLADLARRHSNLQFVLCHCGYPADQTPDGLKAWRAGMSVLATCPNIAIKISGFGIFDSKWTTESIRPLVEFMVEKFGVDRCFFASNFPVDKVFSTYGRIWDSLDEITKQYSENEQHKLFRGTAEKIYRI